MATSSFDEVMVIETDEQFQALVRAYEEAKTRKVPLIDNSEDIFERIKNDTEYFRMRHSDGIFDNKS